MRHNSTDLAKEYCLRCFPMLCGEDGKECNEKDGNFDLKMFMDWVEKFSESDFVKAQQKEIETLHFDIF